MIRVEQLRHDTAALHRFVRSIVSFGAQSAGPQVYSDASDLFFRYIAEIGRQTLDYLEKFVDLAPSDPSLFYPHRQKLWSLRGAWRILHYFIKPAADADTLHFPTQWVAALTVRLRVVSGFENTQFAVFHTSELNYLHLNTEFVQTLARKFCDIIPNANAYPDDLGLIGIPYSQSTTFFPNCLIAHEIGHYVYQKKRSRSELDGLDALVARSLYKELTPIPSSVTEQDVRWCVDRLRSWFEELFSDLFAVHLIGPVYCYAYVELGDLPRILNPDGQDRGSESEFSESHPADTYRLSRQVSMLKKLSWWSHVEASESHHFDVLKAVASIDASIFTFPCPERSEVAKACLQAFLAAAPDVEEIVQGMMSAVDPCASEFARMDARVRQYLKVGVVPSTLVDHDRKCTDHPSPVAVVNAAYKFYLDSLDELMSGIEGEDRASVASRAKWLERLELWALKAIEDHQLLSRETN